MGIFYGIDLRSTDEYSGCFNTGSDETDQFMGINRMGAALSIYGLCAGMDIYRKTECFGSMARWIINTRFLAE